MKPSLISLLAGLGLAVDAVLAADAKETPRPPDAKLSTEQATQIALKAVPGKPTAVTIEKKRGQEVYVVEIQTANEGERDVLIDMRTGAVVGTE